MPDSPQQTLLLDWLATAGPARPAVLDRHAECLSTALAEELLALAKGGPSYGGDRQAEAAVQVALLELAAAVADRVDAQAAASEARRLLAGLVDLDERRGLLAEASRLAFAAGAWRQAYEAERDLALALAEAGRTGEVVAAADRALGALLRSPASPEEGRPLIEWVLGTCEGREEASLLGLLHRWLAGCRERGDRLAVGQAAYLLGAHVVAIGEYDEAIAPLREAVALLGEMGETADTVRGHLSLFVAHYALGRQEAAARHLEEALRLRERITDPEALDAIERQFGGIF